MRDGVDETLEDGSVQVEPLQPWRFWQGVSSAPGQARDYVLTAKTTPGARRLDMMEDTSNEASTNVT